jgi:hypothetical protein
MEDNQDMFKVPQKLLHAPSSHKRENFMLKLHSKRQTGSSRLSRGGLTGLWIKRGSFSPINYDTLQRICASL